MTPTIEQIRDGKKEIEILLEKDVAYALGFDLLLLPHLHSYLENASMLTRSAMGNLSILRDSITHPNLLSINIDRGFEQLPFELFSWEVTKEDSEKSGIFDLLKKPKLSFTGIYSVPVEHIHESELTVICDLAKVSAKDLCKRSTLLVPVCLTAEKDSLEFREMEILLSVQDELKKNNII